MSHLDAKKDEAHDWQLSEAVGGKSMQLAKEIGAEGISSGAVQLGEAVLAGSRVMVRNLRELSTNTYGILYKAMFCAGFTHFSLCIRMFAKAPEINIGSGYNKHTFALEILGAKRMQRGSCTPLEISNFEDVT